MPLSLTLIVAILGCFWRIVLGGANKWASWSKGIIWLRWCWDFSHDEPVLRRSVIMAVCPLLCAPVWSAPIPWWTACLLTVAGTVQWVWPGRDFAVWWSLLGAHGLWAVFSVGVLYTTVGWNPLILWPLLAPLTCVAAYHFGMRVGDDRIGQGVTGAAVFGCLTLAVW